MTSQREVERKYQKLLDDVNTKEFFKIDLTNRVNVYACGFGHFTKTIDIHAGVTPMFMSCPQCGSQSTSSFYKDTQPEIKPSHEWFRPSLKECMKFRGKSEAMLDHILMGGLELRPINHLNS